MVRAYVLIQAEVGKAGRVAAAAGKLKEVKKAAALAGPYDAVLEIEATNMDALGRLVVAQVQSLPGVTRTLTCPVIRL